MLVGQWVGGKKEKNGACLPKVTQTLQLWIPAETPIPK